MPRASQLWAIHNCSPPGPSPVQNWATSHPGGRQGLCGQSWLMPWSWRRVTAPASGADGSGPHEVWPGQRGRTRCGADPGLIASCRGFGPAPSSEVSGQHPRAGVFHPSPLALHPAPFVGAAVEGSRWIRQPGKALGPDHLRTASVDSEGKWCLAGTKWAENTAGTVTLVSCG